MKAEFHKDLKNWRSLLYFFSLLLLLFASFMSENRMIYTVWILYFPIFIIYITSYKITDDDVLTGNGKIPIKDIQKLVIHPDGLFKDHYTIDLYYLSKEGMKINIKQFYPKNRDLFLSTLKKINPKIEII